MISLSHKETILKDKILGFVKDPQPGLQETISEKKFSFDEHVSCLKFFRENLLDAEASTKRWVEYLDNELARVREYRRAIEISRHLVMDQLDRPSEEGVFLADRVERDGENALSRAINLGLGKEKTNA